MQQEKKEGSEEYSVRDGLGRKIKRNRAYLSCNFQLLG